MTVLRGTTVPLDSLAPFKAKDHSFRYRLTPTEREVAKFLLKGASTRDIAAARGVSIKAVEGAITNILGKLGVSNRQEAIPVLRDVLTYRTGPLGHSIGADSAWLGAP